MNTSNNTVKIRSLFRKALLVVGLLLLTAAGLAVYALFVEPDRLVVNQHVVTVKKAGKALDGLKIVAVSDLHGGSSFIDSEKLKRVSETVNSQNPDIVFILGDFVSQEPGREENDGQSLKMPMSEVADSIRSIEAKYGVFAVIGNHDDWYDRAGVKRELERVGIRVLVDELEKIEINGSNLYLLGLRDFMSVGDTYKFREEARALVKDVTDGDLLILDHSPDIVPVFDGPGSISDQTRLFFAGHTHGGQVWFPIFGSLVVPSSYGQTFAAGLCRYNDSEVFVTTGVGTSILPIRFMVPPEIAVVTIKIEGRIG